MASYGDMLLDRQRLERHLAYLRVYQTGDGPVLLQTLYLRRGQVQAELDRVNASIGDVEGRIANGPQWMENTQRQISELDAAMASCKEEDTKQRKTQSTVEQIRELLGRLRQIGATDETVSKVLYDASKRASKSGDAIGSHTDCRG